MLDSARPVILVPGDDPLQIAGSPRLQELHRYGDVVLHDNRPTSEASLVKRAREATAVINSRGQVQWPESVLRQLPKLKMITACGIGTDAIDLETARELDIVVSNIPGRTAPVVAEHAFCLLLAVSRRLAFQTAELKSGRWTMKLAMSLHGKTLGVIGTGNIGCRMIEFARNYGMEVIAWSFHPDPDKAQRLGFRYVDLDTVLSSSDAVSVHVKLTDDSLHLIGEKEFAKMKPGSLFVNTARGAVVDSQALAAALESEHLAGAGLDVFETEPLPADDALLRCEQVVLSPHNADQTPEGMDLLNQGCVENVIAFFKDCPQNVVN